MGSREAKMAGHKAVPTFEMPPMIHPKTGKPCTLDEIADFFAEGLSAAINRAGEEPEPDEPGGPEYEEQPGDEEDEE